LNQNNFTGCFECKCAGGGENNNVVEIEEEKQQQQQEEEDSNNVTTNCEPITKENCLYNDHAYIVGENFQVVFKMYFLFCIFCVLFSSLCFFNLSLFYFVFSGCVFCFYFCCVFIDSSLFVLCFFSMF